MVDYKSALVNAGAFAVGAASFIAGVFILPQEFGNLERLIMVVSIVGVYSVGHACGQRFAESAFRSEKENLHAALDDERRKNAELEKRWSEEEASRTIEEQRNSDADRILKLSLPEHVIIDRLLTAEANGKQYRARYTEALGHLQVSGVIEDYGNGDVYMIKMNLRPFFERYADAIHEIATGTNDDRVRIAEEVRQGTYEPRTRQ